MLFSRIISEAYLPPRSSSRFLRRQRGRKGASREFENEVTSNLEVLPRRGQPCQLVQARGGGFLCYFFEMQGVVVLHIITRSSRGIRGKSGHFLNCLICDRNVSENSNFLLALSLRAFGPPSFRRIRFLVGLVCEKEQRRLSQSEKPTD